MVYRLDVKNDITVVELAEYQQNLGKMMKKRQV